MRAWCVADLGRRSTRPLRSEHEHTARRFGLGCALAWAEAKAGKGGVGRWPLAGPRDGESRRGEQAGGEKINWANRPKGRERGGEGFFSKSFSNLF